LRKEVEKKRREEERRKLKLVFWHKLKNGTSFMSTVTRMRNCEIGWTVWN